MKKQLLIADDDESVRKMVARVLESAGYAVTSAGNGGEALGRLRRAQPDLVLLDLETPRPEGWRVFDQISQLRPQVPVILITALPNQQEQASRRGIPLLMEKPLDLALLLKTIADLLAEPPPPLPAQGQS